MIPALRQDGNLAPGIHWAEWDEFATRFGYTAWRNHLLSGLKRALKVLKAAGCKAVYVDGSFATGKPRPGDYDACWDTTGVDPSLLDPVLLQFGGGSAAQKVKYGGELFPAHGWERRTGKRWLDFFQTDKLTGAQKGIVAIDLRSAQI